MHMGNNVALQVCDLPVGRSINLLAPLMPPLPLSVAPGQNLQIHKESGTPGGADVANCEVEGLGRYGCGSGVARNAEGVVCKDA